MEKATQNVKAELITRRPAYATLALKINNLHQIDKPEHFFELGEKILKVRKLWLGICETMPWTNYCKN